MPKGHPLSELEALRRAIQIAALNSRGLHLQEIAAQVGITPTYVSQILATYGIKSFFRCGRQKGTSFLPRTPTGDAARKLRAASTPYKEIAKILGISRQAAWHHSHLTVPRPPLRAKRKAKPSALSLPLQQKAMPHDQSPHP